MEKGYRDYGHDIDNTDDPFEAGLGFAVSADKPGGFIGRDALLARRNGAQPSRRLAQVRLLDPGPLLSHAEIVYRNGEPVGYIRAASYGHTIGGAVGLVMIEAGQPITSGYVDGAAWEVDVAGTRHAAVASLRSLYDPDNLRIRV